MPEEFSSLLQIAANHAHAETLPVEMLGSEEPRVRLSDFAQWAAALATQDTVTMIRAAIRGLLRVVDATLGVERRSVHCRVLRRAEYRLNRKGRRSFGGRGRVIEPDKCALSVHSRVSACS